MNSIGEKFVIIKGIVLIVSIFIPFTLFAQIDTSSPNTTLRVLKTTDFSINYNQSNNIYYWKGIASVKKYIGKGMLSVNNSVDINRIKLKSLDDRWKDSNRFSAQYLLPVNNMATSIFTLRSTYLSDRQTGFLNNIRENTLNVQVPLKIRKGMTITPSAGYKADKRIDRTDSGPQFGINLLFPEQNLGKYTTEAQGQFLSENLSVRNNNNRNVIVSVFRSFTEGATDTLIYNNSFQRRDYYIKLAGDLETRKEATQTVTNKLHYAVNERTQLRVKTEFTTADVGIFTVTSENNTSTRKREDRKILIDTALVVSKKKHLGALSFIIQDSQQRYRTSRDDDFILGFVPFTSPDNDRRKIGLGFSADGSFFKNDSYNLKGYVEKMKYDTPSDENFDDRDELRYWVQSIYSFNFNPKIRVSVQSLASFDHLVYIFGERSADNNWNRIFQVRSEIKYISPTGFNANGRFSVLANYVDYDFNETFTRVRSFVFRRFSMYQSVNYPLTRKGKIEASLQIDLEENGLLRWKDFIQSILIDRTIVSGSFQYAYRLTPSIQITPGLQIFSRSETNHQIRVLNEFQKRFSKINDTGVTLAIHYRVNDTSLITLNSSKRFVSRGGVREEFQYVDMSVNYLF
jgi:hypothetical protein